MKRSRSSAEGGARSSPDAVKEDVITRIRLPKLTLLGKGETLADAVVETEIIDLLQNADITKAIGTLSVLAVGGREQLELLGERVSSEGRSALKVALHSLLAGEVQEAATSVDGASLLLRMDKDPATVSRRGAPLAPPLGDVSIGMPDRIVESFRENVESRLHELPTEYAARRDALRALHYATQLAIARTLEDALNQHVASIPHGTYEEKQVLVKWVNAELRHFGLAVRCPKTSLPGFLVCDQGRHPDVGRFRLEVIEATGLPRRTVSSVSLPTLTLMAEPVRRKRGSDEPGRSR